LQKAGETLSKADAALSKGDDAAVNQLAYLTRQQVAIAQETAKRKAAEAAVVSASAQRDQVRLAARTAEADAARQQVAMSLAEVDEARRQAAIAQQTAEQQALIAQQTAEQKAAALEAARAQAERDQAVIAQQEQQLKELNAKQTARGMVITLGDVLFSVNKAELSSGGVRNVQKLADFLNQYPQRKVLIEGHTDSTGSLSINQPLSERRADAVRTALVGMGISGDRIQTRGYADAHPVASNNTAAGRQLNRRVEIILSDDNGNIVPREAVDDRSSGFVSSLADTQGG
jgi:outer membrane protein OmpA-like peptidoglycan-associated protein